MLIFNCWPLRFFFGMFIRCVVISIIRSQGFNWFICVSSLLIVVLRSIIGSFRNFLPFTIIPLYCRLLNFFYAIIIWIVCIGIILWIIGFTIDDRVICLRVLLSRYVLPHSLSVFPISFNLIVSCKLLLYFRVLRFFDWIIRFICIPIFFLGDISDVTVTWCLRVIFHSFEHLLHCTDIIA